MSNAVITLCRILSCAFGVILGLGIMAADNPMLGQLLGVAVFVSGGYGLQELVQEWL